MAFSPKYLNSDVYKAKKLTKSATAPARGNIFQPD